MPGHKKKKKLSKAEEANIAKYQYDAYVRARDNGHNDYIEMAKNVTVTIVVNNGKQLTLLH